MANPNPTATTLTYGTAAAGNVFTAPPPTVTRRRGSFSRQFLLGNLIPRVGKIVADRPQDKPRQAGDGRRRSSEHRALVEKRIAATPRSLPLRKRNAQLAKKCSDAGVRNAPGLVAVRAA